MAYRGLQCYNEVENATMSMKEGKRSAVYTVNLPIQQFRGVVAYLTRMNTAYRVTHMYANGIYPPPHECHAIYSVSWIVTLIFIRGVIIQIKLLK